MLLSYARKNYKSPQGFKSNPKKQTIMTTSIQTSAFGIHPASRHSRVSIYSVTVNGEDGNYQQFEIEASSEAEAHKKADDIAQQNMIDVTYVEVYRIA